MVNHVSLTAAAAQVSKLTNDSLDVLIVNGAYNNAETFKIKPSAFAGQEDLLRKDLIASIDVNVLGVVHSINAFLPLIRKGIFKKIIVISTGLADVDVTINSENPMSVVYSTSKAALNMIVAKYAAELKSEGVILLALSPGVVNTKETIRMRFLHHCPLMHSNIISRQRLTFMTASAQEIADYAAMVESFQKFAPHWKGAITPAESVELQKKVIDNVTIAESGAFLSHWGNKSWL
jgi:NAD(P)-dependent dehydrogenase (short-subunit alcohol dehydrogenase family)